jgi:hypothetical protein
MLSGYRRAQTGTDNSGFRSTGTSSAARVHGIGWSLLRKHVRAPKTGLGQRKSAPVC